METITKSAVILILLSILGLSLFQLIKSILDFIKANRTAEKIDKFFAEHRTKTAELMECMKEDGLTYTTHEFQGKYRPWKAAQHNIPSIYYVRVKCQDKDLQYIAIYQIRSGDYKVLREKYPSGSTIEIPNSWHGYAYKII